MPQPNQASFVDPVSTSFSVQFRQDADSFVFNKVFPTVPTDVQSAKFYTFDRSTWHLDDAQRRGDSEESAGSGYTLSNTSYFCDVWALHKDCGAQTKANHNRQPLDWRRNATQFITERLMIKAEREWAAAFFVTGVWGTTTTPANLWSDFVNSDPLGDVETAKRTVLINTGSIANTMVIGYDVYRRLKLHPDIRDQVKYTSDRTVTAAKLAEIFEVDNVYVCRTMYNSAVENETASYGFVHGKHALLCHVPKVPGLEVPSAGYTVEWTGLNENGLGSLQVSEIDIPEKKTTRIEGEFAFDFVIPSSALGYLFLDVVS